jgi:hypothetical protein
MEAKRDLFTTQKIRGAKVIHKWLRGANPKLSSPLMNNFWNSYKGWGEGLVCAASTLFGGPSPSSG